MSAVESAGTTAQTETPNTNLIEDVFEELSQCKLTETSFADEQNKDLEVMEIVTFLETGDLPTEE